MCSALGAHAARVHGWGRAVTAIAVSVTWSALSFCDSLLTCRASEESMQCTGQPKVPPAHPNPSQSDHRAPAHRAMRDRLDQGQEGTGGRDEELRCCSKSGTIYPAQTAVGTDGNAMPGPLSSECTTSSSGATHVQTRLCAPALPTSQPPAARWSDAAHTRKTTQLN